MNRSSNKPQNSYLILAPAAMTQEPDPKKSAQKCFDSCGLDPDSYRIGHTKASTIYIHQLLIEILFLFMYCYPILTMCTFHRICHTFE